MRPLPSPDDPAPRPHPVGTSARLPAPDEPRTPARAVNSPLPAEGTPHAAKPVPVSLSKRLPSPDAPSSFDTPLVEHPPFTLPKIPPATKWVLGGVIALAVLSAGVRTAWLAFDKSPPKSALERFLNSPESPLAAAGLELTGLSRKVSSQDPDGSSSLAVTAEVRLKEALYAPVDAESYLKDNYKLDLPRLRAAEAAFFGPLGNRVRNAAGTLPAVEKLPPDLRLARVATPAGTRMTVESEMVAERLGKTWAFTPVTWKLSDTAKAGTPKAWLTRAQITREGPVWVIDDPMDTAKLSVLVEQNQTWAEAVLKAQTQVYSDLDTLFQKLLSPGSIFTGVASPARSTSNEMNASLLIEVVSASGDALQLRLRDSGAWGLSRTATAKITPGTTPLQRKLILSTTRENANTDARQGLLSNRGNITLPLVLTEQGGLQGENNSYRLIFSHEPEGIKSYAVQIARRDADQLLAEFTEARVFQLKVSRSRYPRELLATGTLGVVRADRDGVTVDVGFAAGRYSRMANIRYGLRPDGLIGPNLSFASGGISDRQAPSFFRERVINPASLQPQGGGNWIAEGDGYVFEISSGQGLTMPEFSQASVSASTDESPAILSQAETLLPSPKLADLPALPTQPGAYALASGRWVALLKNEKRRGFLGAISQVANTATGIAVGIKDAVGQDPSAAPSARKAGRLIFTSNRSAPTISNGGLIIVYVGVIPPPPGGLNRLQSPAIEVGLLQIEKRNRTIDLYEVAPGLANLGPGRLPAQVDEVRGDITFWRPLKPLSAGHYAVCTDIDQYEFEIP